MERVRQELYLEEQEELVRNHERVEIERKLRQRIDLQKQHADGARVRDGRVGVAGRGHLLDGARVLALVPFGRRPVG